MVKQCVHVLIWAMSMWNPLLSAQVERRCLGTNRETKAYEFLTPPIPMQSFFIHPHTILLYELVSHEVCQHQLRLSFPTTTSTFCFFAPIFFAWYE
jgi:hypothetical protein